MGNTMAVALKNLANAVVQKNDTVERLVISNSSLSVSLAARNTEIARLLTVITNLSTGVAAAAKRLKPPLHPGTPWAIVGRTVSRYVSATAVICEISARTGTTPTSQQSVGIFRWDANGIIIGSPVQTDGANQRGEHEYIFNNIG